jgi:hypothetical protein
VYRGQVDGKDNGFSVRCLKDWLFAYFVVEACEWEALRFW